MLFTYILIFIYKYIIYISKTSHTPPSEALPFFFLVKKKLIKLFFLPDKKKGIRESFAGE